VFPARARSRRSAAALAALTLSVIVFSPTPRAGASTGPTTPTFVLAWGNYGTAPGQFAFPPGIATDPLGNVYVADQQVHRIQKFDRLGNVIQILGSNGTGSGQFSFPGGVAIDASGNIYVADSGNHRIQKFSSTGAYLTQWGSAGAGNGQFSSPSGVAVDAAGNVYVADVENSRIQKFNAAGVYVTQWGTLGSGDGQLKRAAGVAADAVGNIYVADNDNHRIQMFSATGAFITKWGSGGSANGQFVNPEGIAVDAAGNVYVADYNNNRIQKFSGAGVAAQEAPGVFLLKWGSSGTGNGQFQYPVGVATDAAGNVYVVDDDNHRIQKFTSTGSYASQWGSFGSGNGQFSYPFGVATDAAGNVYVTDTSNHRIQKFSSTGAYVLQWGSNGTGSGQFNQPTGVAVDAAGNVYVTDTFNHRVQKFTSTGAYLTEWASFGSGAGQLAYPWGIATDAFGNVYVGDRGNFRIVKFTSTGTFVTQWNAADVAGVATDALGTVFAVGRDYNVIQEFTSNGTLLAQWGSLGSGDGQVQYPRGIATDASGNLYVADGNNHRIQKFVRPASVTLVSDVRNDQGRQAQIRFLRCSADAPNVGATITGYEIYRRNDPLPGAELASAAAAGEATREGRGPAASPMGAQLAGWTYLMTAPAHGETEYNVVVPTLVDATATANEYTAYLVRAVTPSPFVFYDSAAENGYSVDNLPPPTPAPFAAAYAAGATHLHWSVSSAADFATFRLYRGASPDFVPGAANLVTATPDTGYADVGGAGSYYKLSAVDRNGNESPFALVGPGQTTDVPGPGSTTLGFVLEGPRPNPSVGGRMLVHFALPDGSPALLELFDLAGRRVAGRAVGGLGAGRHAVELAPARPLAAGVYLLRLTRGAHTRSLRAVALD
jgi:DNA-binding beta-propeller fold protein YncE